MALRIRVVTQRHGTLSPFEVHQGILIYCVFVFRSFYFAAWSYLASSLYWMMRNKHFQIIHAHRSSSGLVAGVIGFLLRKPVLYKLTRGDEIDVKGFPEFPARRALKRLLCLRITVGKFVSLTEQTVEDLRRTWGASEPESQRFLMVYNFELSHEEVMTVNNGIRRGAFLGLRRQSSHLRWPARSRDKGVDWLLEIWLNRQSGGQARAAAAHRRRA